MNNPQTYSTDSFQLAAYLLSQSIKLESTDKTNPRRVLFLFEDSRERKTLTEQFLAYKAVVEPHRFFSAQKDLKQMIYSEAK
jgi:hypothetical protein